MIPTPYQPRPMLILSRQYIKDYGTQMHMCWDFHLHYITRECLPRVVVTGGDGAFATALQRQEREEENEVKKTISKNSWRGAEIDREREEEICVAAAGRRKGKKKKMKTAARV
ncbi:hypothetical protein M9H77_16183 [Catharanthus roseus]|uniref:Uncharacterized protein n=1 Tax=Catharanthus roseus TaxID=4058 RepID=A0ACC0B0M0_CATRO|nr:hypothetical protein M9H77_16183 [Catharanthus roseus]